MKAVVGPDGKVSFEVEGDSEAEIFKQIARVQEVFDHNKCGKNEPIARQDLHIIEPCIE